MTLVCHGRRQLSEKRASPAVTAKNSHEDDVRPSKRIAPTCQLFGCLRTGLRHHSNPALFHHYHRCRRFLACHIPGRRLCSELRFQIGGCIGNSLCDLSSFQRHQLVANHLYILAFSRNGQSANLGPLAHATKQLQSIAFRPFIGVSGPSCPAENNPPARLARFQGLPTIGGRYFRGRLNSHQFCNWFNWIKGILSPTTTFHH